MSAVPVEIRECPYCLSQLAVFEDEFGVPYAVCEDCGAEWDAVDEDRAPADELPRYLGD